MVSPGADSSRGGNDAVDAARLRAVQRAVLVGLVAALLEAVPLGLALYGAVLLTAWIHHRWDPTWNDGDAGIAAGGVLVLVIIASAAGIAVREIARAGRLPVARTVSIATVCSLALASIPALVLATR